MFDVRSPAHRARIGDVRDAAIGADEDRGKLDRLAGQDIDHARGGDDGLAGRVLRLCGDDQGGEKRRRAQSDSPQKTRTEEHTSEPQSLMRISSAAFCWKKKT